MGHIEYGEHCGSQFPRKTLKQFVAQHNEPRHINCVQSSPTTILLLLGWLWLNESRKASKRRFRCRLCFEDLPELVHVAKSHLSTENSYAIRGWLDGWS